MKSLSITPIVVLLGWLSQVRARNDWTKPCWDGKCSYDVARSDTSLDGSLRVWGSTSAVSDITEAGGWFILDCDPNKAVQDIRVVCKTSDTSESGCNHVTQNGAVGTIVRLPRNCGNAPFARVTKWGPAKDQSIPADIAAKVDGGKKRAPPVVRAATIDSDFSQNGPDVHGSVEFEITSGGTDDEATAMTIPPNRRRLAAPHLRRIFGFPDIFTKDFDFTKEVPITLPEQTFSLGQKTLTCAPLPDISVQADAVVSVDAKANFGVHVKGALNPFPDIKEINLQALLNGDVGGSLKFKADLAGSIDTGEITLFSRGFPGLDFGPIFKLGPILDIKGRSELDLQAQIDVELGLKYHLDNVGFKLGSGDDGQAGGVTTKDSPLKVATSANIDVDGSLTVHIIPVLSFGLDALGGNAKATVFVNLDASATLHAQITAHTQTGNSTLLPSSQETAGSVESTADEVDETLGDAEDAGDEDATSGSDVAGNGTAKTTDNTDDTDTEDEAVNDDTEANGETETDSETSEVAQDSSVINTSAVTKSTATKSAVTKSAATKSAATKSAATKSAAPKSVATKSALTKSAATKSTGGAIAKETSLTLKQTRTLAVRDTSVEGCFDVSADLNANVGVEGAFFNLFDANKQIQIFDKKFKIFQKCFGGATPQRRSVVERSSALYARGLGDLVCPSSASTAGSPETIQDGNISGSSITAV